MVPVDWPLMPRARTLESVVRTIAYGILAVFFIKAGTGKMLGAILWGGALADYLTWLIRSVMLLPEDLFHGCYDGCVNLLVGWFVFRVGFTDAHLEEESLAVAFLAFLLVVAFKVAYYGVKFAEGDDG